MPAMGIVAATRQFWHRLPNRAILDCLASSMLSFQGVERSLAQTRACPVRSIRPHPEVTS